MNDASLLLKAAIYEVGLLFNQQPSDERITAYARALQNYTPGQVTFAFNQIILSGSAFFPSLAEILKFLRPQTEKKEDLAPVIVAEMIRAIRAYGKWDEARMLTTVSEDARQVFQALGNTTDIRNSDNIEITKAQLERLAKGVFAARENAKINTGLEKVGINGNVLHLKTSGMRGLSFNEFQAPEDK